MPNAKKLVAQQMTPTRAKLPMPQTTTVDQLPQ
jgi:hypothetical protein